MLAMLSLDWIHSVNMQNYVFKKVLYLLDYFWIGKQSRLVGHLIELDSK